VFVRINSSERVDEFVRWKCDNCDYQNPPNISRCQFCGVPKKKKDKPKPKPKPKPSETWACPRCTLINPNSASNCQVCQTKRPSRHSKPTVVNKPKPANSGRVGRSRVEKKNETKSRIRSRSRNSSVSPGRRKYKLKAGDSVLVVASGTTNPVMRAKVKEPPKGENDDIKVTILDTKSQINVKQIDLFLEFGKPNKSDSPWDPSDPWSERRSSQTEAAHKNLQVIEKTCKAIGAIFIDPEFRPSVAFKGLQNRNRLGWTRAGSLRGRWSVIGSKGISSSDIAQGELGNCWFLSALSVLAERPKLLQGLFVTKELNRIGCYQIMFFSNGEWKSITIDDSLPIHSYGGLAFSKARGSQLWVPFIEKAYAKLYGSYQAIEGGHMYDALSDLTGVPCESVQLDEMNFDSDLAFARLVSFQKSGFLLGASCGNSAAERELFKKVGLQKDHAYAILDIRLCAGGLKLVKLRNPWGKFEWKGAWSDNSKEWKNHPNLAKELLTRNTEDGIFWMSFHDVLMYFRRIDICKLRPNWFQKKFDAQWRNKDFFSDFMYEIRISRSTWMSISAIQKDLRGSTSNQQYRDMGLIAVQMPKASNRTAFPIASVMPKRKKWVDIDANATDEGKRYFVLPVSMDTDHKWKNFKLSIDSAYPVIVRRVPMNKAIFRMSCQEIIRTRGRRQQLLKDIQLITLTASRSSIWYLIVNASDRRGFQMTLNITNVNGLSSSRGSFVATSTVPPLHKQIIMVMRVNDSTKGYSMRPGFEYRYAHQSAAVNYPKLTDSSDLHFPTPL